VLYVAASAILVTVAIRWMEKRNSPVVPVRHERNLMATASMTSLFVVGYVLGVRGLGAVPLSAEAVLACKLLGSVLVAGGAVLTLGLSFVMRRADFRLAYKVKACLIGVIVALAAVWPPVAALLWLPVFSAMMSLSGHCLGTLVIRQFGGAMTMRSCNSSDESN
jgi:hypothetical protein